MMRRARLRARLAVLYARRESLRAQVPSSYHGSERVRRALVQLEGEIALLEVRAGEPPRL